MKKLAMSMVALVMAIAMMVTATAAGGKFINSVAQVGKPELQGNREVARGVYLLLTPYADRRTLPDEGADMEAAYASIEGAETIADLCKELANEAKELGVSAQNLVVSDIFDLSLVDIDGNFLPDQSMTVTVSLKAELLEQFVGLMRYNNGTWEYVEGATVSEGKYLSFKADKLDTFAVVVNRAGKTYPASETSATKDSPETGDAQPWAYAAVLAVAALGVFAVTFRRKQSAE